MVLLRRRKRTAPTQVQEKAKAPATTKTAGDGGGRFVRLLLTERRTFAGFHNRRSPGVESRFSSKNVEATVAHLRTRARLIAEKNPFVFGRLKTHEGVAALWIPESPPPSQEFLTEVFVEETQFASGLGGALVKKGRFILNKDNEPVVKLCVIRSKDENVHDFVLTLSVSHVIGEMNMIYNLWGMLNESAPVITLEQERVHNYRGGNPVSGIKGAGLRKFVWYLLRSNESPFRHEQIRMSSQEDLIHECSLVNTDWIASDEEKDAEEGTNGVHQRLQESPTHCSRLSSKNSTMQKDLVITCSHVNMDWIQQQKAARLPSKDVPYVSTQDILTAWFFSQWDTAGVAVAYDMRRRCKRLSRLHMGNYLEGLVLFPKEYKNPSNIRRAIQSQGRWEPPNNKPGTKNPRSVGGITGWHSLYQDLSLPQAQRMTHSPLRDAWGQLPPLKNPPLMVLFKTSPKQYAIWTLTREEIKDRRALGDELEF